MNSDKQWNWFNKDIQKYIKENDLLSLGSTYYEMAEFLKKEGKDDSKIRDLGYKTKLEFYIKQLKEIKDSGVGATGVEIMATTTCPNADNNSCEVCLNLDGKVFPLKEALSSNPLPAKDCSFSCGCRCVYCPTG